MGTNINSLKPMIEAARRVHLSPAASAIFFHLLYQIYYFGDSKAQVGETIGYGRLAKELPYSRLSIIKGIQHLKRLNMVIVTPCHSKYGNNYLINEDASLWVTSIEKFTSRKKDTSKQKYTGISKKTYTTGGKENFTQQTGYTNKIYKQDKGEINKEKCEAIDPWSEICDRRKVAVE